MAEKKKKEANLFTPRNSVFDLVEGLSPVDPERLKAFQKEMAEEVIPEVIKIVQKRRLQAAKSRHWQLKC